MPVNDKRHQFDFGDGDPSLLHRDAENIRDPSCGVRLLSQLTSIGVQPSVASRPRGSFFSIPKLPLLTGSLPTQNSGDQTLTDCSSSATPRAPALNSRPIEGSHILFPPLSSCHVTGTSRKNALPSSLRFMELPSRSTAMYQQANDPTVENSLLNARSVPSDQLLTSTRSFSAGYASPRRHSMMDCTLDSACGVRKKSGELVKSSMKEDQNAFHTRARSLPSTPTYKLVHFGQENVCYFKTKDRPNAISASNSPTSESAAFFLEDDSDFDSDFSGIDDPESSLASQTWELTKVNFSSSPFEARLLSQPMVVLQDIFVFRQKSVVGHIAAKNVAFEKSILVRYSLDNWETIIEQPAYFTSNAVEVLARHGYDRFTFQVDMTKMFESLCLNSGRGASIAVQDMNLLQQIQDFELCIKYSVKNQEFWDNNETLNYRIVLVRKPARRRQTEHLPFKEHHGKPKYSRKFSERKNAHHVKNTGQARQRRECIDPVSVVQEKVQSSTRAFPEPSNMPVNSLKVLSPIFSSTNLSLTLPDGLTGKAVGARQPQSLPTEIAARPSSESDKENIKDAIGDFGYRSQNSFNSPSYQNLLEKFCFFSPSSSSTDQEHAIESTTRMIPTDVQVEMQAEVSTSPART